MVRSSALHCGFSGYTVLHKMYCYLHNAYSLTTKNRQAVWWDAIHSLAFVFICSFQSEF